MDLVFDHGSFLNPGEHKVCLAGCATILSGKKNKKSRHSAPRGGSFVYLARILGSNDFISLTIDPHPRPPVSPNTSTKTDCNQHFSLQTLPPPPIRFPLVTNSLHGLQRLSLLPRASDLCILPTGTKDTVPQPTYVSRIPRHKMLNELRRLCARTDHDCGINTRWMGYCWVCWILMKGVRGKNRELQESTSVTGELMKLFVGAPHPPEKRGCGGGKSDGARARVERILYGRVSGDSGGDSGFRSG